MRRFLSRLLLLLAFANLGLAPVAAAIPIVMDHGSSHCQQASKDHEGMTEQAPTAKADRCCMPALPPALMPSAVAAVADSPPPLIDSPTAAASIQQIAGTDPPPPRRA